MTQPVSVSVVIVSWNARDYLSQCLDSLTDASCRYPMEIIVVDNASRDGSPEMVLQKFSKVRLIQTGSNLGFAKANNLGIRISTGTYVALINSDVKVLDRCLTRLVDFAEANPKAGMVGPRIIGRDGNLQRSCRGFPTVWNMCCRSLALDTFFPKLKIFGGYALPYWPHDTVRTVEILSGCFWLARRDALDAVGLLDESFFMYGEDMDWCKRFWADDWQLYFLPQAEAIHYGGGSSANAPVRFFIEQQRADLQYWKKHHSGIAQIAYFLLSSLNHMLRIAGYFALWLTRRDLGMEARFKLNRSLLCLKWMFFRGPIPTSSTK